MTHNVPNPISNPMGTPESSDAALDLLLSDALGSSEDEIRPSSGFAASVMEAIEAPAAIPPPIPFPWRRALPGAVILACAMAAFIVLGIVTPATQPVSATAWNWSLSPLQTELVLGADCRRYLDGRSGRVASARSREELVAAALHASRNAAGR